MSLRNVVLGLAAAEPLVHTRQTLDDFALVVAQAALRNAAEYALLRSVSKVGHDLHAQAEAIMDPTKADPFDEALKAAAKP